MVSNTHVTRRPGRGALVGLMGVVLGVGSVGSAPVVAADPSPSQPAAAGCPATGGILRAAVNADSSGFLFSGDNPSIWPRSLVYLSLTRLSPDGRSAEADAAESWEIADDFKTFTFHLRDGLTFSDGSPLTSADVVATFESYLANETLAPAFPVGLAATAPDPSTVVFTTEGPTPMFAERYVAEQGIFPAGSDLDTMNTAPLSGGPFLLDSWEKGQLMVFKKNPTFWNQPYPCLDEVHLQVVADSNTQALQLQAGQIDYAQNLPANQLATLDAAENVVIEQFPTWKAMMLRLDQKKQPAFTDVNVRQAMNHAIDKQAVIDAVLFGAGTIEDSPLPRTPNYVAQPAYAYDLAKAQELMAASGYPDGFATTVTIASGDVVGVNLATIVKDQLAQIGIDVTIEQVDPATQFEMFTTYQYEMAYTPFTADTYDDAQYICYVMSNVCGIDAYWSGYNNPRVEELVTTLNTTTDPAARAEMLAEIQSIVWTDADQLYIAFMDAPIGVTTCVEGLVVPPTAHYYFETMYKTC
jgi:peptide/nickel transport system substrate-binding protein